MYRVLESVAIIVLDVRYTLTEGELVDLDPAAAKALEPLGYVTKAKGTKSKAETPESKREPPESR